MQYQLYYLSTMQQHPYLSIPVPFIRYLHSYPENGISMLVKYGICGFAKALNVEYSAMLGCLASCLITGGLPDSIERELYGLQDGLDRNGFSPDGIEMDLSELKDKIARVLCSESLLNDRCEAWYRIRWAIDQVASHFDGINLDENELSIFYRHLSMINGEPFASIRADILNSYNADNRNSERYRISLALYMGIKSIVGKDDVYRTTTKAIKARMVGAKNEDELNTLFFFNPEIKDIYDYWTTRKRFDGLMSDLMNRKMIVYCKFGNRIAISCSLSDNEFAAKLRNMKIEKQRTRIDVQSRKATILQVVNNSP